MSNRSVITHDGSCFTNDCAWLPEICERRICRREETAVRSIRIPGAQGEIGMWLPTRLTCLDGRSFKFLLLPERERRAQKEGERRGTLKHRRRRRHPDI